MLVVVIVRVMPILPLPGRGRAGISFDDFHTVLAEVVQRPVLVVGEQPHHPVGPLLGRGIDKEEGTACPGVAQPALFCPVVDHNLLDRLGQDGAFLLQARRHAQGLLAPIEPKITLGYTPLLEAPPGPLGLLSIIEQHRQIADGGGMPGAQGSFGRLLGRPVALLGHQRSPPARSARRRFPATLASAAAMRLPWPQLALPRHPQHAPGCWAVATPHGFGVPPKCVAVPRVTARPRAAAASASLRSSQSPLAARRASRGRAPRSRRRGPGGCRPRRRPPGAAASRARLRSAATPGLPASTTKSNSRTWHGRG